MSKKQEAFRTMIGGQAIIEGIMMRGPAKTSIVVRSPDGIVSKDEEFTPIKDKYPVLGWPFLRGVVNFVGSMGAGMKALTWSADVSMGEELAKPIEEPSRFEAWLDKKLSSDKAQKAFMAGAMVIGVVFAVGLFILLPALLATLLDGIAMPRIVRNLIEGALRLGILLGYMALVSRMKDIKRVFSYHGAEHKTIACYEAGAPLTVENVRGFTRFHPRCGTSFLLTVVIISVLVFSLAIPFQNMWLRMGLRLLLLPVVVSISYEINRYMGKHDHLLSRILRAPGLWLQRLTTNEPDDSMIEVGIEALSRVLPAQTGADSWGKAN